jgi:dihydrodipicolinate synthase/N-acetylneuraminate lyase
MLKHLPRELAGIFAALPTPFGPEGEPLWEALDALVDFSLDQGLKGLCLGGATGEYAACSIEHRQQIFHRVARRINGRAQLIGAIGCELVGQVRQLARAAADCGAIALLFPPPAFLRYAQEDLVDFMAQVSADLPLPVLIYHLPQFTRDLGISNVLRLVATVPNIIGLKDSSGHQANLAEIQAAQAHGPMVFMMGSDDLLFEAFEHGAAGAISGIASGCPELVLPLYQAFRAGELARARNLQAPLNELLGRIQELPVPWAMKLALRARGLEMGSFPWPMGPNLSHKAQAFQDWYARQTTP